MNRRTLLQSAAISAFGSTLQAQRNPTACPSCASSPVAAANDPAASHFPGTQYQSYCRCLPDFLARLSKEAVAKRDLALAGLNSAHEIELRQSWVTETLWKLLAGKLDKTELNPRVTGEVKQPGYRVEKLIYESRPNLFVTANLYVPLAGSGPFPAVLFQSGHSAIGKGYPSYQRCCQGLVQLGYVVLAFDPMGQGERVFYLDETGTRSRLKEVDTEHTVPGMQYLLVGDTATRFQLWDAIRSLDLLLSRPEVDPSRVASVGHSGGATLTMFLAAADSRLAAACVCMGNLENIAAEPFLSPGATDDAEQNLIGAGPLGMDRWDLLYPFAPKPLLTWPSDRDYFATYSPNYVRNAWQEHQKLRHVYQVLGHADRLGWADTPLPHGLAYPSRLLVYKWLARWFQDNQEPIHEEPPVKPLDPAALWATPSGSVIRSLHSATPFSLLQSARSERRSASLTTLIGISLPASTAAATIASVRTVHVNIDALEVRSEPEVTLPAFLFAGFNAPKKAPVLLALDDRASDRLWFSPEADDTIAPDCPVLVCAADVRGVGTLTPQFSPGAADYEFSHQQEDNYAISSLYFGRPLVGQRVRDILSLVDALRRLPSTTGRPIHLAASGRLVFPALLAAALDLKIVTLYLSGGVAAFRLVTQAEVPDEPFANYIPNWLNHTDIPELVASLAPRKVIWAGPVDAVGVPLQPQAASELFQDALTGGSLTLRSAPEWSSSTLLSLFL